MKYVEKYFEPTKKTSKKSSFKMQTISSLPMDDSDRNRTSPVAFTGNKFEFRMLGSSMNASELNIIVNLSLAKALDDFYLDLFQYFQYYNNCKFLSYLQIQMHHQYTFLDY